MTRSNADFRGIPEHNSITMMTPAEILDVADYEGSEYDLDRENKHSGLRESLAKGYDPNHVDTRFRKPEVTPITIEYPKNGGRPTISDGNHRVRLLTQTRPGVPVPVRHWRMQ
jgi:hypothetical protein